MSDKKARNIKLILLPAVLLLITLTIIGCGNDETIFSPEEPNSETLGEVKSSEAVSAAPSIKSYHGEGWINQNGGTINVTGGTKVPQDGFGQVKSIKVLADSSIKIYSGEGWINQNGGTINVTGGAKVIIPQGALDNGVYITVTIEVDELEPKIHYLFGPHGTFFNVPVTLEMTWSYLKDYNGPLELWYLEDNGELTLVEDAIPDQQGKKYHIHVNHFSEYYFLRR
jgi:hypothetical protein